MRYIGCKRRLLSFIHNMMKEYKIEGETFCDLFSGTATVGNYFKQQGYRIISNDILYSSYVQQQVKVGINSLPDFLGIADYLELIKVKKDNYGQEIIDYLNQLKGSEGFIYSHYSPGGTARQSINRMYFTDENSKQIDSIRETLADWQRSALITSNEFYILLYALLEQASKLANTTATQGSFLKVFKQSSLRSLQLKLPIITNSSQAHQIYCQDGLSFIEDMPMADILYVDPPYTTIQYSGSYHLLETIARWHKPIVTGVTGRPAVDSLKSPFCSRVKAKEALKAIVARANYHHLLFSYSNEGIISHEDIMELLEQQGRVVFHSYTLPRYNTVTINHRCYKPIARVEERLYYLQPDLNKEVRNIFKDRTMLTHRLQ